MNDIQFACATDVGRVRDHNEDNFSAIPELGLWVVADGMGGHVAGEVASAIAVEHIPAEVRNGASLAAAVATAHQAIIAAGRDGQGTPGMGCTVVALRLIGCDFEVSWVGDSRAYLWNGCLHQLTRDHSFVQQLIDSGTITEEESRVHPQRSVITQALGVQDLPEVQVDTVVGSLTLGQKILLCSDGLTSEVVDGQIATIIQQAANEELASKLLIAAANDNGGSDNTTVVLVSAPNDPPSLQKAQKGDTIPLDATRLNRTIATGRRRRWMNVLLAALILAITGGIYWWYATREDPLSQQKVPSGVGMFSLPENHSLENPALSTTRSVITAPRERFVLRRGRFHVATGS